MSSSSRVFLRLLAILVMVAVVGHGRLACQVFQIADISPDTPYNTTAGRRVNTGGRTIQIVVDPNNDNTLYLATDIAGVWQSTDAGQHWSPANNGIHNPMTLWSSGRRPLGIDDADPRRLLYATSDDDLRIGRPWGGLYYSDSGAATWHHVDLPNCHEPSVGDVLFSGGIAYISTRCGMFIGTGDLTNPANWSVVNFPAPGNGWQIAVSGSSQFACMGSNVYRRTANAWSPSIGLGGECWDITVSPDVPSSQVYVIQWAGLWQVQSVDFVAKTSSPLGNNLVAPDHPTEPDTCCGQASVWVVRRPNGTGKGPGRSFDVFVSSQLKFYQYDASTSIWNLINEVHDDTFAMAFPSSYNPEQGNCTAYMTNDGGVNKNVSSGTGCALWDHVWNGTTWLDDGRGKWIDAMAGLHTMFAYTMAVVPWQPGPAIYLPTGDNETWGTIDGGVTWQDMGCCGDSGKAVVDLALPQQMVTMRNGLRPIYRSSGSTPPVAGDRAGDLADGFQFNNTKDLYDGTAPPQQGAFAQVMTLSGETPEAQGDYLQAAGKNDPNMTNEIIRTTTGAKEGWHSISAHFQGSQIGSILPAGGHTNTVVYVMTGDGQIFRSQVSGDASTGIIPDSSWQALPFPGQARVLYANPYDPNVLFAMDMTAGIVRSSPDGGQQWTAEDDLTRILSRNHEFITTFNPDRQTTDSCTLNSVFFDRSDPNIRAIASVTGALAFSRDGGAHWISLNDAVDANTRPSTVAYDSRINPQTNTSSLYYNALNRSLTRIDGPFSTLESATYELRGFGSGYAVSAVNATTGKTTTLTQEADGVYRGYDDVFDSAVFSTLSYHLVIDGQSTAEIAHTLTDREKAAGVVMLAAGLQIVEPTTAHPSYAGTSTESNRVLVRVSGGGLDVSPGNLTVLVAGTALTSAQIPTVAGRVGGETWFVIAPGAKPTGCYDLAVSLTTPAGASAAQSQSLCYNDVDKRVLDRLLAVDQTNSMNWDGSTGVAGTAKMDAARAAAKFFVDLSNPGDQIGVISFQRRDQDRNGIIVEPDELSEMKFPMTVAGEGATDQRPAARNAIELISPDTTPGFTGPETSIGAALVRARTMLHTSGGSGHEPNIVLLTDGLENYPPYWARSGPSGSPLRPGFESDNIRVDTVGLGGDSDDALLTDIAGVTGGEFRHLNEGSGSFFLLSRLAGWYKAIDEDVRGEQRFFYQEGFPKENTAEGVILDLASPRTIRIQYFSVEPALDWMTVAFHANIDNAARISLFEPGSSIPIVVSPPGVTFRSDPKHAVYRILHPKPGRWFYRVQPNDLSAEFFAVASAPTLLMARIGPHQLGPSGGGFSMPLRVWIADAHAVLHATVSGDVREPNGIKVPVTLFDDGAHLDGAANDAIYGFNYIASQPGPYDVELKASGTSNSGEPFERYLSTTFVVPGQPKRPVQYGEGLPGKSGGGHPLCECASNSKYSFALFGGRTFPQGTFGAISDSSYSLGLKPAFHFAGPGGHWSAGLYLGRDSFENPGGRDFRWTHLSPELEFTPALRLCPVPSLHIGVGSYWNENGDAEFGYNLGASLGICIRKRVDVLTRYDFRSVNGFDRNYSTVQLGVRIHF